MTSTHPDLASPSAPDAHEAQPRSLWSLALTELWERFSFYGLQGVLTFYLIYSLDEGGLALDSAVAVSIVGAYGGSVYLSQILGAWVADRLIAPRYMVLYGAIIITLGHVALALVPGVAGLVFGLALIVLGTGALKTNITAIVGMLYSDGRGRRDAGFSYFYMAINTGAVVGPLATGLAQSTVGFHLALGLAAIGMVGGLVQYVVKMKHLPAESAIVPNPISPAALVRAAVVPVVAVAVAAGLWLLGVVTADNLSQAVTVVILVAAVTYFSVLLRSSKVTAIEKRRVVGFAPLWVASLLYFGLLFQKFTTISVFITERVDRQVGSWEIPAAWLTTASPLSAVLLTPVVAYIWSKARRQPTTPAKFAIGLTMIGGAYLLLMLASLSSGRSVSPFLVLICMVIAGSSEIFVGPIGLSLVTLIAPERFKAQTVALIFLTLAGGSAMSGLLGQLFTAIPEATYFLIVGLGGLALALALRIFSRSISERIDTF